MDKRRLDFHLQPAGNLNGVLPSVKDSEGDSVLYTALNRITDETTVVDIGTSPNANDGDPIRTAYIKINNFIEAMYHTNYEMVDQMNELEFRGPFLGHFLAAEFPGFDSFADQKLDPPTDSLYASGDGTRGQKFKMAILSETLKGASLADLNTAFTNVTLDTTNSYIRQTNGQYYIRRGSIILYDFSDESNLRIRVIWQPESNETTFNYAAALNRYSTGGADTNLDSDAQIDMYNNLNRASTTTGVSNSIQARNTEDALVEMYAKLSQRGLDAGYYG